MTQKLVTIPMREKRSTIDFEQQVAPTSTASHASFCEGTIRHSDPLQSRAEDEALRRGVSARHGCSRKVSWEGGNVNVEIRLQ